MKIHRKAALYTVITFLNILALMAFISYFPIVFCYMCLAAIVGALIYILYWNFSQYFESRGIK